MNQAESKYFNIRGPCDQARHYMLPVLPRLPEVNDLIKKQEYIVLYAPRQSGKTTFIQALVNEVNNQGQYYALYCSLEGLQGITELTFAISGILDIVNLALSDSQISALNVIKPNLSDQGVTVAIRNPIKLVCQQLEKELVLFFDEVDCLSETPLITFLRQLRQGYNDRSQILFPRTIVLIGLRNIRDYKVKISPDRETTGSASPFNIATVLTLANFTQEEIATLYGQHTKATGQFVESLAIERAWYWSEGQPWLVNALVKEVIEGILKNDYSHPITGSYIDAAAETLIQRRDTHIDYLLERLKEPRVRAVMEPVFTGSTGKMDLLGDEVSYCYDLGLIKMDNQGLIRPSNPLYAEVMIRVITYNDQMKLPIELKDRWMDGKKLDMSALLAEFQKYWRENAEMMIMDSNFKKAAPHLALYSFLQRVVDGGAKIVREYALGTRRVDINVSYEGHNYPVELKIRDNSSLTYALKQTYDYMDKAGAEEGWLVYFDQDTGKSWDEKISWQTESYKGKTIYIVGC